jgi:DNA helicase-2/ATP-dependent DNA helicase PcrA
MTRARTLLFLTYALSRRTALEKEGRTPSRFLSEIPTKILAGDASPGTTTPVASPGRLSPGVVVRHARFGDGTIVEAEPPGTDQKITVLFRRAGRKKLVARFAKLEVLKNARPAAGRNRRPYPRA